MFNFLKKKLKTVVDKFSKQAELELEKEVRKQLAKETIKKKTEEKKKPTAQDLEDEKKADEAVGEMTKDIKVVRDNKDMQHLDSAMEEIRKELKQKETELQKSEKDKRKGGIISRVTTAFKTEEGVIGKLRGIVTTTTISEKRFDELFEEMEIVLLENNVALEVIDKIKDDLKNAIVNTPVPRGKVQKAVTNSLRESIEGLFQVAGIDLVASARGKKPYVILFAGINGSGKTTTIAKLAKLYKDNGMECVIAAADTFRAAAIQQIQLHAKKIGVPVIKHDYGADPAAVAYDAVSYAKAKNIDVVLIDTAGRQHSNKNLIAELAKIARVTNPDLKIFVGESITGNDCTNQAAEFNNAIGVDGIILAKADVDEKGGAAISVSYVTKKPIIYLGTGQDYADLTPFNPELVVKSLGLAA